jgi:exonuclease III
MRTAPITIATLNIGACSRSRAERIIDEWINPNAFDVLALTETSSGSGTTHLHTYLTGVGYLVYGSDPDAKDRGALVATRLQAIEAPYPPADPLPWRSASTRITGSPDLGITGLYVPNRSNDPLKLQRKRTYLDVWREWLLAEQGPLLVLGDLNVVPPTQKPKMLPQMDFEYEWYSSLTDTRFVDCALAFGGTAHEATWVSHFGEPYTYDHMFISPSLRSAVRSFAYDHTTRGPTGVTDHSALILTIELAGATPADPPAPHEVRQTELF